MILYVELWKAKPAWLALDIDKRRTYLDSVSSAMSDLAEAGVEMVGWAHSDTDTPSAKQSNNANINSRNHRNRIKIKF